MQNAFVLHRRRFKNSSLIIELFSQTAGRVTVISKGALRQKNYLAGTLQPFIPLSVNYVGRSQIKTLVNAEENAPSIMLTGDKLYCGLYLNELLIRLIQKEISVEPLFKLYHHTLLQLLKSNKIDVVLRYFELGLLEALGYQLPLIYEADSQKKIMADNHYLFYLEQGALPCSADHQQKISGATLIALQEKTLEQSLHRQQAKQLLRTTLHHYLGYRHLKTKQLMIKIRK